MLLQTKKILGGYVSAKAPIFLTFIIGGYFGAGWFRDIWRIPEYVKDVNNDPNYLTMLSEKMREMPKPPIKVSLFRFGNFPQ